MSSVFEKHPVDVLDYVFDFARFLSDGDAIASVTGVITSATTGATAEIDSSTFTDTTATLWVSGGIDGETADVSARVVTDLGRTKECCIRIRVKDDC